MVKELEKDIQRAIISYLSLRKCFFWRNNSGALKTEHGGFIRFGSVGAPDIFVVKNGQIYGLEVKTKKGVLSEEQIAFSREFIKAGGNYLVVRSVDDVIRAGF